MRSVPRRRSRPACSRSLADSLPLPCCSLHWVRFRRMGGSRALAGFVALTSGLTNVKTLEKKLDFLSRVALFWFTADGPYGVPEWGFAVDTMDVLRFVVMALLVGVYGALWLHARQQGRVSGWRASASRSGGVVGAFASVLGLSTGPCSVVGCGAPVLPVVGLVFTGLSSGTLAVLSVSSRIAGAGVLVLLSAAVAYLGWQVARAPRQSL